MEIELRVGMKFLEVKTGIIWELISAEFYGPSVYSLTSVQEDFLYFKAIYESTNRENEWVQASTALPNAEFERRLRKGKWKQINNRKNNYY